jgi:hypothetical protein
MACIGDTKVYDRFRFYRLVVVRFRDFTTNTKNAVPLWGPYPIIGLYADMTIVRGNNQQLLAQVLSILRPVVRLHDPKISRAAQTNPVGLRTLPRYLERSYLRLWIAVFARLGPQRKFEIFPNSNHEFFWKVVNAQLTFVLDAAGKVVSATHSQNGRTFSSATADPCRFGAKLSSSPCHSRPRRRSVPLFHVELRCG